MVTGEGGIGIGTGRDTEAGSVVGCKGPGNTGPVCGTGARAGVSGSGSTGVIGLCRGVVGRGLFTTTTVLFSGLGIGCNILKEMTQSDAYFLASAMQLKKILAKNCLMETVPEMERCNSPHQTVLSQDYCITFILAKIILRIQSQDNECTAP